MVRRPHFFNIVMRQVQMQLDHTWLTHMHKSELIIWRFSRVKWIRQPGWWEKYTIWVNTLIGCMFYYIALHYHRIDFLYCYNMVYTSVQFIFVLSIHSCKHREDEHSMFPFFFIPWWYLCKFYTHYIACELEIIGFSIWNFDEFFCSLCSRNGSSIVVQDSVNMP